MQEITVLNIERPGIDLRRARFYITCDQHGGKTLWFETTQTKDGTIN